MGKKFKSKKSVVEALQGDGNREGQGSEAIRPQSFDGKQVSQA